MNDAKIDEKYLNAMAGTRDLTVQQMIKPLVSHNLRQFGIVAIEDIQLVEQETTQSVNLLVLYKTQLDKMVGTRAVYPVTHLAVFELTYGKPTLDDQCVNEIKLITTVTELSRYATRIIPATPIDDFCYLTTPYSLCLVRLEKNRVNEIMTSSAANAVAEHFSTDPNKPFEPVESKTQRSVLNYTSQELKLDFTTRVVPLPGHRVLVCNEMSSWQILSIRFDQANLDVADVTFLPIACDEKITPSKIAIVWKS
jgi:hypothetical protein